MRYTLEVQKLLNRAEQENIKPRDAVKLLIQAIQIADANDDVELAYDLRSDLMDKEWGLAERSEFVNTFSWMLNAYDADPENYNIEDLLWKYKWIISELFSNPKVPLEQIDLVLEDYKRRITEQGFDLRSYYTKLLHEALDQQDGPKTKEYLDKMNALPIDEISDCRACEMDNEVLYQINEGNFEEAYLRAQPLLKKEFSCAHVPVITFCHLCYLAIKSNMPEKAAELFLHAEEELHEREDDSSLIRSIGLLIVYLFRTDKEKGWKYVEKYLPWALECEPNREFFFSMYMAEALKQENQQKVVHLELPGEHPLFNPSNSYLVSDLFDFYYSRASTYSIQFDERNRNSNYALQLEKALS